MASVRNTNITRAGGTAAAVVIAAWCLAAENRAQAPQTSPIAGAWTLNRDLSDQPPSRDSGDRRDGGDGTRRGGGYGRGGGMRGGGFGGGMGRGGGRPTADPEEMARMRDAMRDILNPPDHLSIVQTDAMIAITAPDGRTTRLSPNGKKIKDDNTKIERKTRWDGAKLVSEINGAGPGKITQTLSVDTEARQLKVTALVEGGRNNQKRTITHVYDADAPREPQMTR
jgi:hypothetical protein